MTLCACSHSSHSHGHDRKGRPTCFGSAMCGCTEVREATRRELPQTADIQDYLRQKGEL